MKRKDEATLALIHAQAMGYSVELNLDGSPRLGGFAGAPASAVKVELSADIATDNPLKTCSMRGLVVQQAYDATVLQTLAETGNIFGELNADKAPPAIAGLLKISPWSPRVAPIIVAAAPVESTDEAALASKKINEMGLAENFTKKSWACGRANKVAAESRFYDHAKTYACLAAARGAPIGANSHVAELFD